MQKNRANIATMDINLADTNSISESEPSVDVLKPKCKRNTSTNKTLKFENLTTKLFPHSSTNPSAEEKFSQ